MTPVRYSTFSRTAMIEMKNTRATEEKTIFVALSIFTTLALFAIAPCSATLTLAVFSTLILLSCLSEPLETRPVQIYNTARPSLIYSPVPPIPQQQVLITNSSSLSPPVIVHHHRVPVGSRLETKASDDPIRHRVPVGTRLETKASDEPIRHRVPVGER